MDGENHGKPYEQMDDLGGKTTIFGKHPVDGLKSSVFILLIFMGQEMAKKWPRKDPRESKGNHPNLRFVFFGFANLATKSLARNQLSGQVTGYDAVMCRSGIRSLGSKYHRNTFPFLSVCPSSYFHKVTSYTTCS